MGDSKNVAFTIESEQYQIVKKFLNDFLSTFLYNFLKTNRNTFKAVQKEAHF